MGHARPARGAGRGEEARHHQGGHRPHDLHRRVQPHVPRSRHGVHGRMGGPHAPHGLLGEHGGSVRHLRQQVHRNPLVAAAPALRQGAPLQGLHHPALLARRGNGPLDPRAEPARMLPRREGHHLHGAVPRRARRPERSPLRRGPRRERRAARSRSGRHLLPGMDHNPLDAALEHGAGRRSGHPLREAQVPQPLHTAAAVRHPGRKPRELLLRRQERPRLRTDGARMDGPRTGRHGHPLRAAAAVGETRGGRRRRRLARRLAAGVPRDRGRLRDHRGRYGHRAHRPDVRCGRRPRGPRRRHPVALHDQPQGRDTPHGGPHGQILPHRGARRRLRARMRRTRVCRIRRPLGEERLRSAVQRRRKVRRSRRTGRRVARPLHLHTYTAIPTAGARTSRCSTTPSTRGSSAPRRSRSA